MTVILTERELQLLKKLLKEYEEGRLKPSPALFKELEEELEGDEEAEVPEEYEEDEDVGPKGVEVKISSTTFSIEITLIGKEPNEETINAAERLVERLFILSRKHGLLGGEGR
jgi:hypothetical protein